MACYILCKIKHLNLRNYIPPEKIFKDFLMIQIIYVYILINTYGKPFSGIL